MRLVLGWPLAVCTVLLAGCVITPPQAISWGASAISYLSTGKSISDHALSMAVGQDCALLRFTEDRPVCEMRRASRQTLASARRPTGSGVGARPDRDRQRPTPGMDRLVNFLVVASFPSVPQAMAYRSATSVEDLRVLPFYAHGVSHYRLVAGPIREGDIHRTRDRLLRNGLDEPWMLTVCSDTLLPPPCLTASPGATPAGPATAMIQARAPIPAPGLAL